MYNYRVVVFLLIGFLVRCDESDSSKNFVINDRLNQDSISLYINQIGFINNLKDILDSGDLILIKEPIVINKLDTVSDETKNYLFLENFILKDSTLSKFDILFINKQIEWYEKVNWQSINLIKTISEKDIDSVSIKNPNAIIIKNSFPFLDLKKEKLYIKCVVKTNSSISGKLIKYKKRKTKWVIIDEIGF